MISDMSIPLLRIVQLTGSVGRAADAPATRVTASIMTVIPVCDAGKISNNLPVWSRILFSVSSLRHKGAAVIVDRSAKSSLPHAMIGNTLVYQIIFFFLPKGVIRMPGLSNKCGDVTHSERTRRKTQGNSE